MENPSFLPFVDRTTEMYLVRHGETEYNRRDIVQGGGIDSSLNDTGRVQAQALAGRLADKSIDTVYASTLRRAKQTAEIVAGPHEPVSKTFLRDLEEMAWGVFEGDLPSPEREQAMAAVKTDWRDGHYDRPVKGGESIREVQVRARRALEHILVREAGRTVVVVAHGRYLRVLLATILPSYELEDMHRLDHANTCVNRVVCCGGDFEAEVLNCTSHLPAERRIS